MKTFQKWLIENIGVGAGKVVQDLAAVVKNSRPGEVGNNVSKAVDSKLGAVTDADDLQKLANIKDALTKKTQQRNLMKKK